MTRPLHHVVAALIAILIAACGGTVPATSQPTNTAATAATAAPGATATTPLEVSAAQANDLREAGAFVIDVREPSEWAAGHIEGATLIPLRDLPSRLAELPKDRTFVVVCRSGQRSAQGRDILRGAGFASVTSMEGGMNDWTAAGLPVVTGP